MDGLASHLDQGYLADAPEAGTAADAANQADPPLKTPEDKPMPMVPVTEPGNAPLIFGLSTKQLLMIAIAAGLTYMLLAKKRR